MPLCIHIRTIWAFRSRLNVYTYKAYIAKKKHGRMNSTMKTFLFIGSIIILILFSSCILIVSSLSETPGFNSGYANLTEEDKSNIIFVRKDEKISDIRFENKIYAITAEQLRDYMLQYDSCLVYFWSSHCKSGVCVSPMACQEFCDKHNYQLIMIAEYYTFPEMYAIMPLINNPLFAINAEYYKTDYCNKYMKKFQKGLLNEASSKTSYQRYWIFTNGQFQRSQNQVF